MSLKRPHGSDKSKMFHSIVLMGSGLAFGCGGVAKVDGAAGGSATNQAGSTGVDSHPGGSTGSGGAGGVIQIDPSGGAPSYAGAISAGGTLNIAGSPSYAGSGGAPFVNPLPCPPSQWACAWTPEPICRYQDGIALPTTNCKCDPSRPARASDCKPDAAFVCLEVTRDTQGNGVYPSIPLACSCEPPPVSCTDACDSAYGSGFSVACYFDDASNILCGCAAPVVLK